MSNVFGILNTGRTALLTQQKAIDVTGHNIANVNTDGYSRQRVNMETNEPYSSQPGQTGTGVRAAEIQRIYDRFLGAQINNENQNLGNWETQKGVLERVEIIFDESSGYGLNQAMSEFWNAWQDLANNPSDYAGRAALLAKSETMTATFNNIYSNLEQIQTDIDTSIMGTVKEINSIAERIAGLNQKIALTEVGGQNANDYRDSRDLLLKELSLKINIDSFENSDGKVTVLVAGGRPLVENISSWNLSTQPDVDSDFQDIAWTDSDGNLVDITDSISGGKLKGWLEARDVTIPDYLSKLDNLAEGIITEVNDLHKAGLGLNDVSVAGRNFFAGTTATNMAVDVDDVNNIAAAGSFDGLPGGNSNAIEIANLQNALKMNSDTATFDDYYNSLVSDVGSGVQKATVNFDHQSSMVTHLDNYRESVSGVSLDEEMVNLIKFQHGYNAAARLISVADELLDRVISMV
ncbi:MAG: flagellar hook-associated protein FlgK [Deltaproteobacteria bacterium]|jgi:flagellar hook-associated protein 1 FlgK|nr:flagellar hook-associated protein FlgK [Desulfobacterales bacterium]MDL1983724.1 flagellar hook-associated protein FlgK [Deltaproteobacteria bacterium]